MATAQSAGDQLGMQSTRAAAGALEALKTAIDFPTFVTSLINGVFQAVTSSSITQLTGLSDLLDNVSTSADSFSEQNVKDEDVLRWVVGKFSFLIAKDGGLALRDGEDLAPHSKSMQDGLSATEAEVSSIDDGDLMGTLGPLVRRKIGKDRQEILGTLVQMGLQRIVVDEGRLHASMDMRVDTRAISEEDKRNRTEFGIEAKASGSFGVGAWGASASVGTSFSTVSSDQQYTKEEIDTRAGLRSSVDLAFRTEQIPLDRMADKQARVKLDLNSRVPANVGDGSLISTDRNVGEVAAPASRPALDASKSQPAKPADKPAQKPPQKPAEKTAAEKQAAQKPAAKQPAQSKTPEKQAAPKPPEQPAEKPAAAADGASQP